MQFSIVVTSALAVFMANLAVAKPDIDESAAGIIGPLTTLTRAGCVCKAAPSGGEGDQTEKTKECCDSVKGHTNAEAGKCTRWTIRDLPEFEKCCEHGAECDAVGGGKAKPAGPVGESTN